MIRPPKVKNSISSISYSIEEEPIILSKNLLDLFLQSKYPGDLIALYSFYYYTAKWQKTNQPKATDNYCMNGLKWGYDRFSRAKAFLLEIHLIEKIQARQNNRIKEWFIKVNFIWKKETLTKNKVFLELGFPRTRKQKTNALSTNNKNALSTNNKKYICENDFKKFWELYPKKTDKGKSLKAWINLCTQLNKKQFRPEWRVIKKAILLQKETERWSNIKFIPNPTTWINQYRWLDDPGQMQLYTREAENYHKKDNDFEEAENRPVDDCFKNLHQ